MSTPPALLNFFQHEAVEYLDRLEQLLASDPSRPPDGASFLAQSRALRGAATMTRLGGLPELCSTLERLAAGVRDGELRWDQRIHFAARGALVEIRALVGKAEHWGDTEHRQARTHSVALAAVAAGYLTSVAPAASPSSPVVPIARLFPDDGAPGLVERNATPPITLADRFRSDMAAAADGVARESANLAAGQRGAQQLALTDALRRTLLGLADVAESYGAASIAGLAMRMARSGMDQSAERVAIQAFSQLLMDRELSDPALAARVREHATTWPGGLGVVSATEGGMPALTAGAAPTPSRAATPAPAQPARRLPVTPSSLPPVMVSVRGAPRTPIAQTPVSARPVSRPAVDRGTPAPYVPRATPHATPRGSTGAAVVVPAKAGVATGNATGHVAGSAAGTHPTGVVAIQSLLYSGESALERARAVRDQLREAWQQAGGAAIDPTTTALLDELSDLLDLASPA